MASPVLSDVDGATFKENTVNAGPLIIDSDVTLTDADGDWDGGQVVVTGFLPEDTISVASGGQIFVIGTTILFEGIPVGEITSGAGVFTVTFNADAATAHVEQVIEHLAFANGSDSPTATRAININVIDAAGNDLNSDPAFSIDATDPLMQGLTDDIWIVRPELADIDGDGDLDLFVGTDGQIRMFENVGDTASPSYVEVTGAGNPFSGLTLNGAATIKFGDLDADGDLEAVVTDNGWFQYFRNDGTAANAVFTQIPQGSSHPFDGTSAGSGRGVPTLVDIDGDGDLDAFMGHSSGSLFINGNVGTPASPDFQAPGSQLMWGFTGTTAPALLDVDSDGDFDLVVATQLGELHYYENVGNASSYSFVSRTGAANPFDGLAWGGYEFYVTTADIDGDGDTDLIGANRDGTIYVVRNDTLRAPTITVTVVDEGEPIVGDASAQTLSGTALGELIQGLDGDDFLDGGAGDDRLEGGQGADYLRGGAGADAMLGGDGDDFYVVDNAGDTVDETGGSGRDRVHASISFTLGEDIEDLTLAAPGGAINGYGNWSDNVIDGNAFTNQIWGGWGADMLNGAGGHDVLYGEQGADLLDGGNGNDTLYGGADIDALTGGAGMDVLDGGWGDDFMAGGLGNDSYFVDSGLDEVLESAGEGTDTVFSSAWGYTLTDNVEHLTLIGTGSYRGDGNALNNTITATDEFNALYGHDGNDTLHGLGGGDQLYGGAGNDVLYGGDGGDNLYGGLGADKLYGGAGDDSFWFGNDDIKLSSQGATIERDTIHDFAVGDRIYLYDIDANVNVGGDQDFVLVSKFTGAAGQALLRYAASTDQTTAEFDVDGDGKADFRLTVNGDHVADHGAWLF
ncbi:MAG: VCBS repeat-containing protein [Caulobacter sp.]|nr:VCBS repeat-containing protein [Caulobacter sp.]